ncbi:RagB/SusD family nutrient uptake outer membrane protein [Bacteroides intestinalis]|uniref:RagB/SusD family nutrient uptake outer membrane protein n=1 Tax=Bacteroides intestinalis TaxID=329854 RepID=UPI001EDBAC12|nr:RagB/SusD family nutrient uptake outer membrane protein [Bacteroides intestinalis]MCG4738565.1 RagB/SusD family nutrient uptake outer membrane protein [Bacteroides intestinalis]
MKLNIKYIIGVAAVATLGMVSCTDEIKFGNAFLEKAPGGTVTADEVFSNPEYTRNFLASIYSTQYYNLPTNSTNAAPQCQNYWKGMPDALGDDFHLFFNNTTVFSKYYAGALSSAIDDKKNGNIYPYTNEFIWENVRHSWMLIERINEVPDMSDAEKARIADEARCLLAYTYFIAFRWYGGLPIIRQSFIGSESSYDLPRRSVESTVNFMLELLDTAIANKALPWAYTGAEAQSETGHWTLAGAMALKCKVLAFAASPLFNDLQPYYQGKYTLENEADTCAWYGGSKPELWTKLKGACDDFFTQMRSQGHYQLIKPAGNTQEDYRYAYRSSYILENSTEILHSVRRSKNASGNDYGWFNLGFGSAVDGSKTNGRYAYCPTQEYVEMFPWADGTQFDWEKAEKEGRLDNMFIQGDTVKGKQQLQNIRYTRDPRLYETAVVNGARQAVNWGDGRASGNNWETWVGGTNAKQDPKTNSGIYATGYRMLKYLVGSVMNRKFPQWNAIMLSDIYLTYAEAIVQTKGSFTEAIDYVDAVRARVGLKGLVECNPDKDLTSNKENLLAEIMRERACELAFQNERYFDLIRYKRADLLERPLHGLRIYRLVKNGNDWVRSEEQWYNKSFNKGLEEDDPNFYEPSHFDFERFQITDTRIWWKDGFDPKWYLQPFPITEVNKNYGLVQNAGW